MIDNRNTDRLQKDERNIPAPTQTRITKGPLRDCVLPDYTGDSDEHFLGGMVTGDEAFELFKAHYENLGHGNNIEVFGVSPAEVFTSRGKKTVWLPDVFGFGQAVKKLKVEVAHRDKEIAQLKSKLLDVNFDLSKAEIKIKTLVEDAAYAEIHIKMLQGNAAKRPWWRFW